MNEPKHLDLFSGIGGFSLAFESEGFRTIGFSEIDPYACAVLKKHWPTVPNYGAVQSVPAIRCDVITGGFPCQPYSLAGKRAGAKDDRALWPAMCAVIERCRPTFVLGENVPGIIGMELDTVLSDLERIGYTARTLVVPACAVDAHHLRSRVWILAHAALDSERRKPELDGEAAEWTQGIVESANDGKNVADPAKQPEREQAKQANTITDCGKAQNEPINGGSHVADANQSGSQRRNGKVLRECSGEWTARPSSPFTGSPTIWEPEPELGGTLDGLPAWLDRHRYLTMKSHKLLLTYATTKGQRVGEILQILRSETGAEDVRQSPGGHGGISPAQVLFSYMCQLQKQADTLGDAPLEGEEAHQAGMRSVRCKDEPSGASCGPRSKKQRVIKYPDSLHSLSSVLALHAEQAWGAYRAENAKTILSSWEDGWEDGFARVANGIPNRAHRLRCLGNSIIPQVAQIFAREIYQILNAK